MKTVFSKTAKVISIILSVIFAVIIISNIYIFAARKITGRIQPTVFGFSYAVVVSGSMEPEISVNDLVITKKCSDYSVNDVIMFESGSSLVTHRIVKIEKSGYVTKGDANNTTDPIPPVTNEEIVGRVVGKIPHIGAFIGFMQTPLGFTLMFLVLFAFIALSAFLPYKNADEGESKGEKDEEESSKTE